jgi:hypothetical protein
VDTFLVLDQNTTYRYRTYTTSTSTELTGISLNTSPVSATATENDLAAQLLSQ